MVARCRTQERYDHRLRELVRTTQDMSVALQHGVHRSTVRGWLAAAAIEVVTADPPHMEVALLQQEVLWLWTRIQQLIALLRILLAVLNISRFSLNHGRLPDGNHK